MNAATLPGVEVAPAHRTLERYLRLTAVPHALALVTMVTLTLVLHSEEILFVTLVVALNSLTTAWAYREARKARLSRSISIYALGLCVIMAAMFAFGTEVYAIATAMAFLPVMMAMPYVSPRGVLRASIGVTLLFSAGAISTFFDPPLKLDLSPQLRDSLAAAAVIAIASISLLTLWYNARLLHGAVASTEAANRRLREGELALEAQIAERTAELAAANAELEQARDAALALDRQTSDFLARMSHELRTPLNAVTGFSELLRARWFGELNEKQDEYVGDIQSSSQHLLLLINDILDLSKVETGQLDLQTGRFDFDAVADSALQLLTHRASVRSISLGRDKGETVGEIEGDALKFKQVLINLLTNAVKFTAPGGTVRLGARRTETELEVWVEDNGCGIAPEDQARIFEPFRQAMRGTAVAEGTGLGLSLSRRIIELHGGHMALRSAPGAGARFSFTLPQKGSPA